GRATPAALGDARFARLQARVAPSHLARHRALARVDVRIGVARQMRDEHGDRPSLQQRGLLCGLVVETVERLQQARRRAAHALDVVSHQVDHGSRLTIAAWVARASRAPHTERGPANRSVGPSSGHTMHTASLAVPVPGTPRSSSACVFASVAVTTAFTSASSDRRTGSCTTTLIVPAAHALMASSVSAAHVGFVMPTVA